jgi:F0F1-type ATP synthase assembly protein I
LHSEDSHTSHIHITAPFVLSIILGTLIGVVFDNMAAGLILGVSIGLIAASTKPREQQDPGKIQ